MAQVAARDLRNHTSEVLRRVESGVELTITVNGRAVAELIPVRSVKPASLPRAALLALLETSSSDPGLSSDLRVLAGDTTDDLGPIT